jgi:hypothetical protein
MPEHWERERGEDWEMEQIPVDALYLGQENFNLHKQAMTLHNLPPLLRPKHRHQSHSVSPDEGIEDEEEELLPCLDDWDVDEEEEEE